MVKLRVLSQVRSVLFYPLPRDSKASFSFVTVPFLNQDPRAIDVVQVILETVLLRREKSMKDRDGNPIVQLPEKEVSLYLRYPWRPLIEMNATGCHRIPRVFTQGTRNLRCHLFERQRKIQLPGRKRSNLKEHHEYARDIDEVRAITFQMFFGLYSQFRS